MENLFNINLKSLLNYFNVLKQRGYVRDSTVEELNSLLFIEDFKEEFNDFITLEDQLLINRVIQCFTDNNCIISK